MCLRVVCRVSRGPASCCHVCDHWGRAHRFLRHSRHHGPRQERKGAGYRCCLSCCCLSCCCLGCCCSHRCTHIHTHTRTHTRTHTHGHTGTHTHIHTHTRTHTHTHTYIHMHAYIKCIHSHVFLLLLLGVVNGGKDSGCERRAPSPIRTHAPLQGALVQGAGRRRLYLHRLGWSHTRVSGGRTAG